MPHLRRLPALLLALPLLGACRTAPVCVYTAELHHATLVYPVRKTLDELYRSFCFDAGGEADWETMGTLVADGATFVAPIPDGGTHRAVDFDGFVSDFKAWIADSPEGRSGLHERIVHTRIDLFGNVAHAWVGFEGFVPPDSEARTQGVDSIQLVRSGDRWLVASFTTQYGSPERPVPARFLELSPPPRR